MKVKIINEDIYPRYFHGVSLIESKADTQKLIDFAGEDLANRFLAIRNRLKSPENDLYYWIKNKTVDELEDFISNIENTKSRSQSVKDIADEGAKLILDTPHWRVYHITTYEASQKYGRDTKWCITGIDGYGDKYWKEYTDQGIEFYFLITKGHYDPRGTDSKIAIVIYPNDAIEVFNQQDDRILRYKIPDWNELDKLPRIGDYFQTELIIEPGTKRIEPRQFKDRSSLESIVIPDSVTSIGDEAFSDCYSLKSITIPDSVRNIGCSVFYKCTSLTSVTIPDSVTEIGSEVFYYCKSLKSITIPDNVTRIGYSAFYKCTSLTSVTIGNSVTSIGEYAFEECISLKSITIPDSMTSIGGGAFTGCTNLTVTCHKDSYAEQYAIENNIPVKII